MKKITPFTYPLLALVWLTSPAAVLAQADESNFNMNLGNGGPLQDPNEAYGLLGNLISTLFNLILIVGAMAAFAFLILGAIQWITAGNGEGAANGRKTMIYALVGLFVMAMVYVLIFVWNNMMPQG